MNWNRNYSAFFLWSGAEIKPMSIESTGWFHHEKHMIPKFPGTAVESLMLHFWYLFIYIYISIHIYIYIKKEREREGSGGGPFSITLNICIYIYTFIFIIIPAHRFWWNINSYLAPACWIAASWYSSPRQRRRPGDFLGFLQPFPRAFSQRAGRGGRPGAGRAENFGRVETSMGT